MVSPIYETTAGNTEGITKPSFPSVESSTIEQGAVDFAQDHLVNKDTSQAAPKNPPSEWSSGPDNNVYLQGK